MLLRRTWRIVLSTFVGMALVYAGFAIFTARLALYPWWYHRADVGVRLTECNAYQMRVYVHCQNPKQAFALDYTEFRADSVTVPDHDGPINTTGWAVRAANPEQAKGTVLLVPGGGADRRAMLKHTDYLHRGGYHVLLLDPHNHGLTPGDGRGISFGLWESQSVISAARWAIKNIPGAAERPVIAMGTSQGAFAALYAMAQSDVIKGVVAENPYISVKRLLREFPALSSEPTMIKEGAFLLLSAWLGQAVGGLDVHEFADRFGKRPVFLIHGKDDDVVSAHQSEEIYDLIKGPKDLWLVDQGRHEFVWNVAQKSYEARVLRFLGDVSDSALPRPENVKPPFVN